MAAFWRRLRNTTVATRDTTVTPVNRNMHDQPQDDEVVPVRNACVVFAHVDSLASEVDKLNWNERGWTPLFMLSADGPDGGMLTWQKGIVRCEVHAFWDGGDDTDTTYIPKPFYEQLSICWHHNRPIIVSDTLRPD